MRKNARLVSMRWRSFERIFLIIQAFSEKSEFKPHYDVEHWKISIN